MIKWFAKTALIAFCLWVVFLAAHVAWAAECRERVEQRIVYDTCAARFDGVCKFRSVETTTSVKECEEWGDAEWSDEQ